MDQSSLIEQAETIEKLLRENSDERGAEAAELILLDELVQIDTQKLKNQAEMLAMDKGILEP